MLVPLPLVLAFAAIAVLWLISLRLVASVSKRRYGRALLQEQKLREAAEMANTAKREFLAALSHEIRTPMHAILGFTELALKTELSPELRDYIDTVNASAQWVMHIVSDGFDFSRIEVAQLELENKELSVEECIRSAMRIVQPEAAAKNLTLRCKVDPQVPAQVKGDATRLRRVIFNLLENAVKFTTSGSVIVSAGLESKSANGVLLRISVADTGIGISTDKRSTIFEPVGSPDGPTTRLGLTICRKLVTLMGGTIDVQSQLGAGSTFEFTAWFEKVQGAFAPEAQSASDSATRPVSVLVAEDNAVNRRLIETLLQSAGHHVTAVANGKQALTLAESQVFDLVFMDVEMPEMDGIEATAAMRESELRGTHVPIYALTAHALSGDRERCLAGGMDGYLSKPVNIDELLRLVSEVAAQRSSPESSPGDLAQALRHTCAASQAAIET